MYNVVMLKPLAGMIFFVAKRQLAKENLLELILKNESFANAQKN